MLTRGGNFRGVLLICLLTIDGMLFYQATKMEQRFLQPRLIFESAFCHRKHLEGEGMVLPFEPMTMTFKDLHYWVTIPKDSAKDRAHVHMEGSTPWLELLLGISGAFRPKVLTCLMGVTGAGKTTLMDVLAGRKTGMPLPCQIVFCIFKDTLNA